MTGSRFSCYVIGNDTLLMECGDHLRAAGHDVRGVITSEDRIAEWAGAHGLRVVDARGDYAATLAEEPFDYLFSITYLAIIPDEVLRLPRKAAINFHDGPLPRYAGLNTPVWALVNGEQTYGVSWHLLTDEVDAGDLLKQATFEVSPSETALSLNTKCLAAAAETFPELVLELADGTETRTPQDLSLRSYFGKFKRPPAACVLDWSATADDVECFVRALTFGPYANPVGTPKLLAPTSAEDAVIVTAVRTAALEDGADASPGTVLEASEGGLTVATGEGAVTITGVRSLSGRDMSLTALIEAWGLEAGVDLPGADSDVGRALGAADESLCRREDFWAARLSAAEPPEVPRAGPPATDGANPQSAALEVPASVAASFGEDAADAVLAAFCAYLARTGRKERFTLAHPSSGTEGASWLYASTVPMEVRLDPAQSARDAVASLREEREKVRERGGYLRDLLARTPGLAPAGDDAEELLPVGVRVDDAPAAGAAATSLLTLQVSEDASAAELRFDASRLPSDTVEAMRAGMAAYLEAMGGSPDAAWSELPLASERDLRTQLVEWNDTGAEYDSERCVHELFEVQVARTPDAAALVFRGDELTYRELDERADRLAGFLQDLGVGADTLVGVHVDRSLDLLVATLGVMKAGGAYLPLDPDFPPDRIAFMVEDSRTGIVITQSALAQALPQTDARVIRIDDDWDEIDAAWSGSRERRSGPGDLAYVIYTSGSTGTPKGVLVEHRNVSNFFTGMDAVVAHDPPGVWLAVTSLSFDISVLELFWTLARGFKVVVYKDPDRAAGSDADLTPDPELAGRPMDFGLFMWGNDDGPAPRKYDLMLEAARYFDANGFDSVWTPERHFHAFGGPFPNPSVTGAALAVATERLGIRSGSCVSPLHHPVRIAEEWAVVDNLSNGRVAISFASGWQPNDFVIRPQNFPGNKAVMLEQIDIVRRLWRGEQVEFENPQGESVPVTTLPRPVQPELPFWMTTAGNPESYRAAGKMGANILTHLLGQSLDQVAEKIAIYRSAREEAGLDPAEGVVTLMLHTFVGDDDDTVRELVREPMKSYLGASMKLVLGFAWSFPAFSRPGGAESKMEDVDLSSLSDEEVDAILDFAFERYFETSGLFGTPATCLRMVEACKRAGVDDIACLLDFGVENGLVLDSLPALKVVRDAANRAPPAEAADTEGHSFAAEVRGHGVTHLQCTPSMARMVADDPQSREALADVAHLMVGGEAFPPALADDLRSVVGGTITNMYGPTETTIWSATHRLNGERGSIPIGRPVANTSLYVLDPYLQPTPLGVAGDLYIGGDGVTRGYHERPELTGERFVSDTFRGEDRRMYWTGDLARWSPDGTLEFLGRIDNQVKIRGYRIELGEIESSLSRHEGVSTTVVSLQEVKAGDQRLVAYFVPSGDAPEAAALRDFVRRELPEYMVPGHFVKLDRLPLTPNGKIDRGALPSLEDVQERPAAEYVEPANELERVIAESWCVTLALERVGVEDNFFDVGGHSLLVVQLHRKLREAVEHPISLVDLYRFPTIRSLTDHLTEDGSGRDLEESADRAEKRRAVLAKRRRRGG